MQLPSPPQQTSVHGISVTLGIKHKSLPAISSLSIYQQRSRHSDVDEDVDDQTQQTQMHPML
jgi:hypothetical protein